MTTNNFNIGKTIGTEDKDQGVNAPHYAKPLVLRIDLALEETLSKGCKLATKVECVGPPIMVADAGS